MAIDPAGAVGRAETSRWREDAEARLLVLRIQRGEREAAGALYERYFNRVHSYLRSGLRHAADAEDLAQQVFASALAALPEYDADGQAPFRGWLFAIARNALADELRRRKRVSVLHPDEIAERRERQRFAPDVAERVERWALEDALARLPERQRQALTLRFIVDLRVREIAWVLGVTEGAVSDALRRGLETMARRLAEPSRAGRVLRSSMRRCDPRLPVLRARQMALLPA